jgi:hypothetical protein
MYKEEIVSGMRLKKFQRLFSDREPTEPEVQVIRLTVVFYAHRSNWCVFSVI